MARRRRHTRTLRPNIRITDTGIQVYTKAGGRYRSKRYRCTTALPTPETLLAAHEGEIRAWLAIRRARPTRTDTPAPDTFRADARTYLAAVTAMPSFVHRQREIAAWVREFGDRPRSGITALEIRTILNRWYTVAGPNVDHRSAQLRGGRRPQTFSARSCNLYRTALSHLYATLGGPGCANPVAAVPKFRPPDPEPRGLAPGIPQEIFAHMPSSKTKARLLAIATIGIRHGQLMRVQPERDWFKDDRVLFIRSGKRSKPRAVPLSAEAMKALKAMDRWQAWGPFSQPSALRAFRRAIAAANAVRLQTDPRAILIPIETRAYDLRHTFAAHVLRHTRNIFAVKELLTHSSLALTERYMLAAVDQVLRESVDRLPRLASGSARVRLTVKGGAKRR